MLTQVYFVWDFLRNIRGVMISVKASKAMFFVRDMGKPSRSLEMFLQFANGFITKKWVTIKEKNGAGLKKACAGGILLSECIKCFLLLGKRDLIH